MGTSHCGPSSGRAPVLERVAEMEAPERSEGSDVCIPRVAAIRSGIAVLVVLWGLAALVAADDIDFFSWDDVRDTSAPHHEHVVVGLILMGLLAPLVSFLVLGRRRPAEAEATLVRRGEG